MPKGETVTKKKQRKNVGKNAVSILICLMYLLPLYVLLNMAFKLPTDLGSRLTLPTYLSFVNFKEAFKAMDGCEVVYEGTYNTNETDFNAILTSVKSSGADVMFVPSSIVSAGLIIKQARDMGLTCKLMAGDTWENATIIENAGADNCEGVAFSTFFDENDASAAEFVKGFKEYLNSSSENLKLNSGNDTVAAVSALGYDAYMTMIEALKAIEGDVTSVALREALVGVSYNGVTGAITFNEEGDANKDMAYIKTMTDGAFKFVGTQKTDGTFTAAE